MPATLGILFLHHKIDDVVCANLSSVRRHNPGATIVTMSAGEAFPGGYSLAATPALQKLHAANPKKSSDWLVCSWFLQRREHCAKWWIVEWDTYCTMSVREYYRAVWEFPLVVSSVRLPYREVEWGWFDSAKKFPAKYRPFAMGGTPFIYLVSDRALRATCRLLLKVPFRTGNGELRFCTAANWCGFPPCGFSPPRDLITWITLREAPAYKGIFHPIKRRIARRKKK